MSWYPPPSRPRPADGIKARSRRGEIGETWWSRQFIAVLESFEIGARLPRGRRYARAGQVLDLAIAPGEVTARVQGSRATPYKVRIRTLVLSKKDWARAEDAMAARAVFAAKLLSGEMPRDIEEVFGDCRLTLFPASARDLTTDCSCPDWSNPCKHIAATYYLLAEAFDADPFLIFRWRGRDRAELLERLGARRTGEEPESPPSADLPLASCVARFWDAGPGLADLRVTPRATPTPDALLRELGPLEIEIRGTSLVELLCPAYEVLTEAAEARAGTRGSGSA